MHDPPSADSEAPEVAVVLGTRPEAIKLAPVILAMRGSRRLACRVYSTGQHRELLEQALEPFGIVPDASLNLMRADQSPADVASAALASLSRCFEQRRPALVLVQGDTTTAMAAALAAFYARIPVAHVEAGLRTGDVTAPFPEEGNRRVISVLAAIHFAPTELAKARLLAEQTPPDRIVVTGNTAVDSVRWVLTRLERGELPRASVTGRRHGHRLVLVTLHRRESFGEALHGMCRAVADLACDFPDVDVVFPVHPNPSVQRTVRHELPGAHANVLLIDPVGYAGFVSLMHQASLIITDSGGVQEEAPSLRVPVLVTRGVTERTEGVASGAAQLVGTDPGEIHGAAAALLRGRGNAPSGDSPYGDGRAAERIVAHLERVLAADG